MVAIDALQALAQLDNDETINLVQYQTGQIEPHEYLRRRAEIREMKRNANITLFAQMQSEKIEASRQRLIERMSQR